MTLDKANIFYNVRGKAKNILKSIIRQSKFKTVEKTQ